MSMFLGFAPWILFSVVTTRSDWRLGLAVGLIAQIVVLFVGRGNRRISVLDVAMIAFFAVAGVFALAQPESGLADWIQPIATAWIGVVTIASILVKKPFTLAYSVDSVSPDIAATDLFMTINTRIAWAWAGAFAGMAAGSFIGVATDTPAVSTIVTIVLVIAAYRFTQRYPDRATDAAFANPSTDSLASSH